MRTSKDLSKEQKARLVKYVARNIDVSSTDLASDVHLDKKTIIAWKAWFFRRLETEFNTLLKGN